MIANRMQGFEASGIRKVFDLAQKIKNPVNLSIGQPDFDVPEDVKKEAITAIKKGFNRYTRTQGIPELGDKILEKAQKRAWYQSRKHNDNIRSCRSFDPRVSSPHKPW